MQIAGASGSVTDMTSVPVRMPETPTEKIYDRRHSYDRRQTDRRQRPVFGSASDVTPALTSSLSARALLGLGLIVFTSGALFATAVYRLRPRTVAARPAPVERIALAPAPAPSVVEIQPLPKPAPEPVLAASAPEPAPVVPPPPAAAVAVDKPQREVVARAAEPRVVPASARPAPAVRARPAPVVRPKRPAQPTETRVAAPSSIDVDPFAPPARPSKKWVDPFAE